MHSLGTDHSLTEKFERAIELISNSDSLLIFGLENLDMDSQMEAWKLADLCQATIDASIKTSARGKMFSMQRHGKVTATFGEINQRADVLVFWFSDPWGDRHQELEIALQSKKAERTIVVINDVANASTEAADKWIQLDRKDLVSAATGLRMTLKTASSVQANSLPLGPTVEAVVAQLIEITSNAKHVAMFLPTSDSDLNSEFDLATESLIRLTTEWNATVPVSLHSFSDRNSGGAEYVLSTASGYPFANNLHRQYSRFRGNEYSARQILDRKECDAAIVFTTSMGQSREAVPTETQLLQGLSSSAVEFLQSIDVIEIGSNVLSFASISIPAEAIGINGESKMLRGDGVMLDVGSVDSARDDDRSQSAQALIQRLFEGVQSIEKTPE